MSYAFPSRTVVVRADEAEAVGGPEAATRVRLLADADATGGALSTQRVTLARGADGAAPHLHRGASELFYVLGGTVQVLSGEEVLTAREGDLVVVPPQRAHAFAAPRDAGADLLIVLAPGVERFEYFRLLGRLRRGEATREELLASQERFDNWFLESTAWSEARAAQRS